MQGLLYKNVNSEKRASKIINYNVAFGFLTLLGVLTGTILLSAQSKAPANYTDFLIDSFINSHKSGSFLQIMSFSFLSGFIPVLVILFCAFSCVGFVIIPLIPFIKGAFCGCLTAYLYVNMGFKGAFLNIILFWLPQAAQALMLLMFATIAFDTSIALFYNTFLGQKQGINAKYRRTFKRFVFTGLGLIFTAIIESALSGIFAAALLK